MKKNFLIILLLVAMLAISPAEAYNPDLGSIVEGFWRGLITGLLTVFIIKEY